MSPCPLINSLYWTLTICSIPTSEITICSYGNLSGTVILQSIFF
jgi:hypothetical protein